MRHLLLTIACGVQFVAAHDLQAKTEHIVHLSSEKHHGNYAPTYQPTESEDRRLAGAPTLRGSYSA